MWDDLQENGIRVFEFSRDADDDESVIADTDVLAHPVFAVSASEKTIAADGRSVRGRSYPWGYVDGLCAFFGGVLVVHAWWWKEGELVLFVD